MWKKRKPRQVQPPRLAQILVGVAEGMSIDVLRQVRHTRGFDNHLSKPAKLGLSKRAGWGLTIFRDDPGRAHLSNDQVEQCLGFLGTGQARPGPGLTSMGNFVVRRCRCT